MTERGFQWSYPAHLLKDEHPADHKYTRQYQLKYSDGKTEDLFVVGVTR